MIMYIDAFLSPFLFGYRKGHSAEQCLTVMLEKWKKALDKKGSAGAILTDLSKAFDCLNHNLLLAKLNAYGFHREALKFISSYLKNRYQRTKINQTFSSQLKLRYGVPQGSILGPLLFNIFINDLFYFIEESNIANYADDNSLYAVDNDVPHLLLKLQNETNVALNWFYLNEMKPNAEKCHVIICNQPTLSVKLEDTVLQTEKSVELLGVTIDKNLNFSDHISNLCKRANQKLHALTRISRYIDQNKLKLLMRAFVTSQFSFCPLVWMFHSRKLNNKIDKLHERALRVVYKNQNLTFEELLEKDNSVTIHQRNLQKLAIEMYKIKHKLSPKPIQELFDQKVHLYNLRNKPQWKSNSVRTVGYGVETISFMGAKILEMIPDKIKLSSSLPVFKHKIKFWKTTKCPCRLCRTYIKDLGFL